MTDLLTSFHENIDLDKQDGVSLDELKTEIENKSALENLKQSIGEGKNGKNILTIHKYKSGNNAGKEKNRTISRIPKNKIEEILDIIESEQDQTKQKQLISELMKKIEIDKILQNAVANIGTDINNYYIKGFTKEQTPFHTIAFLNPKFQSALSDTDMKVLERWVEIMFEDEETIVEGVVQPDDASQKKFGQYMWMILFTTRKDILNGKNLFYLDAKTFKVEEDGATVSKEFVGQIADGEFDKLDQDQQLKVMELFLSEYNFLVMMGRTFEEKMGYDKIKELRDVCVASGGIPTPAFIKVRNDFVVILLKLVLRNREKYKKAFNLYKNNVENTIGSKQVLYATRLLQLLEIDANANDDTKINTYSHIAQHLDRGQLDILQTQINSNLSINIQQAKYNLEAQQLPKELPATQNKSVDRQNGYASYQMAGYSLPQVDWGWQETDGGFSETYSFPSHGTDMIQRAKGKFQDEFAQYVDTYIVGKKFNVGGKPVGVIRDQLLVNGKINNNLLQNESIKYELMKFAWQKYAQQLQNIETTLFNRAEYQYLQNNGLEGNTTLSQAQSNYLTLVKATQEVQLLKKYKDIGTYMQNLTSYNTKLQQLISENEDNKQHYEKYIAQLDNFSLTTYDNEGNETGTKNYNLKKIGEIKNKVEEGITNGDKDDYFGNLLILMQYDTYNKKVMVDQKTTYTSAMKYMGFLKEKEQLTIDTFAPDGTYEQAQTNMNSQFNSLLEYKKEIKSKVKEIDENAEVSDETQRASFEHNANIYQFYLAKVEQTKSMDGKSLLDHQNDMYHISTFYDPTNTNTPFDWINQARQEALTTQAKRDAFRETYKHIDPVAYTTASALVNFYNGAVVDGVMKTASSLGLLLYAMASSETGKEVIDGLKRAGGTGYLLEALLVKDKDQMANSRSFAEGRNNALQIPTSTAMQQSFFEIKDGEIERNIGRDNTIAQVANGLGQMFVLLEGGAGIQGSLRGTTLATKLDDIAKLGNMTKAQKAGNFFFNRAGLLSSSMTQQLGKNYVTAIEQGMEQNQAIGYTFILSSISSLLELISPQGVGGASGLLTNGKKVMEQQFKLFIKQQGYEVVEENIQEITQLFVGNVVDGVYGLGNTEATSQERTAEVLSTMYVTSIITLCYGGAGQINNSSSTNSPVDNLQKVLQDNPALLNLLKNQDPKTLQKVLSSMKSQVTQEFENYNSTDAETTTTLKQQEIVAILTALSKELGIETTETPETTDYSSLTTIDAVTDHLTSVDQRYNLNFQQQVKIIKQIYKTENNNTEPSINQFAEIYNQIVNALTVEQTGILSQQAYPSALLFEYNKTKIELIDPETITQQERLIFTLWTIEEAKTRPIDLYIIEKIPFKEKIERHQEQIFKIYQNKKNKNYIGKHRGMAKLGFTKEEIKFLMDMGILGKNEYNNKNISLEIENKTITDDLLNGLWMLTIQHKKTNKPASLCAYVATELGDNAQRSHESATITISLDQQKGCYTITTQNLFDNIDVKRGKNGKQNKIPKSEMIQKRIKTVNTSNIEELRALKKEYLKYDSIGNGDGKSGGGNLGFIDMGIRIRRLRKRLLEKQYDKKYDELGREEQKKWNEIINADVFDVSIKTNQDTNKAQIDVQVEIPTNITLEQNTTTPTISGREISSDLTPAQQQTLTKIEETLSTFEGSTKYTPTHNLSLEGLHINPTTKKVKLPATWNNCYTLAVQLANQIEGAKIKELRPKILGFGQHYVIVIGDLYIDPSLGIITNKEDKRYTNKAPWPHNIAKTPPKPIPSFTIQDLGLGHKLALGVETIEGQKVYFYFTVESNGNIIVNHRPVDGINIINIKTKIEQKATEIKEKIQEVIESNKKNRQNAIKEELANFDETYKGVDLTSKLGRLEYMYDEAVELKDESLQNQILAKIIEINPLEAGLTYNMVENMQSYTSFLNKIKSIAPDSNVSKDLFLLGRLAFGSQEFSVDVINRDDNSQPFVVQYKNDAGEVMVLVAVQKDATSYRIQTTVGEGVDVNKLPALQLLTKDFNKTYKNPDNIIDHTEIEKNTLDQADFLQFAQMLPLRPSVAVDGNGNIIMEAETYKITIPTRNNSNLQPREISSDFNVAEMTIESETLNKENIFNLQKQILEYIIKTRYQDEKTYMQDKQSLDDLLSNYQGDIESQLQILQHIANKKSFPLYSESEIKQMFENTSQELSFSLNPTLSDILTNGSLEYDAKRTRINQVLEAMGYTGNTKKKIGSALIDIHTAFDNIPVFQKSTQEMKKMSQLIQKVFTKNGINIDAKVLLQVHYFLRSGLLGKSKTSEKNLPAVVIDGKEVDTSALGYDLTSLQDYLNQGGIGIRQYSKVYIPIGAFTEGGSGYAVLAKKKNNSGNGQEVFGVANDLGGKMTSYTIAKNVSNIEYKKIFDKEYINRSFDPKKQKGSINTMSGKGEALQRLFSNYPKITNIVDQHTGQIHIPLSLAQEFVKRYSAEGVDKKISYNEFIREYKQNLWIYFNKNFKDNKTHKNQNLKKGVVFTAGKMKVKFIQEDKEMKVFLDKTESQVPNRKEMTMDHIREVSGHGKSSLDQHERMQLSIDLFNMAFIPADLHTAKNTAINALVSNLQEGQTLSYYDQANLEFTFGQQTIQIQGNRYVLNTE